VLKMTPGRHAIIAHPAAAILALALIYIVSGQLALMLALPPGYVSAIFPPAGIALAALAVGGTRLVPGVAIGASALVVLQGWAHHGGLSGASILAAGAVATGSAVQAWIGGALVRRWLAPALDSARDVLLFLLLAPLVCVISASCAIPALFGLGMLTSGDLLTNWLIWWAGDTVGVLLVAPLAWILIGTPRPAWRSRRWLLSLPLCLSSAAFIAIYTKVSVWEQEQLMLTFRLKSQQVGDMLQSQFSEHERLMYTVAGLFNKRHADSATEFSKLARSYLGNRPELRLMAWAPRVPAAERAQFEHWAEGHVGPGFLIRQFNGDNDPIPAATRSEYYPMIFREPLTGNERAHGIDLLSEPQRAAATRRTIASGRPAATAPLTLIHGQGSKRGILLQQAINLTTDIKPGEPAGILVVLLQFEPYLQHALVHVDFPYFLIRLEDRTAAAPEVVIDTLDRPAQAADSRHTLKLGGREYHLTLAPSNLYLKTRHGWQSWAVLSGGLLLTGLLGAFQPGRSHG
jgi:CHASE1-domain containing sensor protein